MYKSKLSTCIKALSTAAVVASISAGSSAAIPEFFQDFEGMNAAVPDGTDPSIDNDGWNIYGANFDNSGTPAPYGVFLFQYGWWEACCGFTPNGGPAFSGIVDDVPGGNKFLNVYGDYNNPAHSDTTSPYELNQALLLKEYPIDASDINRVVTFTFDARLPDQFTDLDPSGNPVQACFSVTPGSQCKASAFVKTLAGGTVSNVKEIDMVANAVEGAWTTFSISLPLDAGLLGQNFQFGFETVSGQFDPTGIYYDNVSISLSEEELNVPIPPMAIAIFGGLLGLTGFYGMRKRSK